MYTMSLLVLLLGAIPEHMLYVLITACLIGRKDILDFRNKANLLKLSLVVFTNIAITILCKFSGIPYVNNILIQSVFFILIYSLILKFKWYKASLGLLINLLVYGIIEFVNFQIVNSLTGITLEQIYQNDTYRLVVFLPGRLVQVLMAYGLYKWSVILLDWGNFKRLTKTIKKKITLINLMVLVALVLVLVTVRTFAFKDTNILTSSHIYILIALIGVLCLMCTILVYTTHKFAQSIKTEKDNNVIDLLYIRSLIERHHNEENVKKVVNSLIERKRR
jgi:lysylphosphatidylglycerol synthetase-like protein (DUF2156 family)